MPSQYRRFYTLRPYLQQESDAGGGGATPPARPDENPGNEGELGDKGKAALDAERTARKTAEREARDAKKELDDLKADAQRRADAEAADQGKWKELAEKRDADLQQATTDLTAATTELETLRAYVTSDIAAITKAVKDAKDVPAAKALMDFYPGDDAGALDLLAWAQKAKPRLVDFGTTKEPIRGNGPSPKPAGTTKPDVKGILPRRQYIN